jgi:hypothetical protein
VKVFVGLGEGIGNVVMGLPLVDLLKDAGHEVFLDLRPTPPAILPDLVELVLAGRDEWLRPAYTTAGSLAPYTYDAACLTHWWLSLGGLMPSAFQTSLGGHPLAGHPEILANLAAADFLVPPAKRPIDAARARLHVAPWDGAITGRPRVGIHPGCKDDPEWKRAKVYPRWAEVAHRLKESGARVVIFGTDRDDAYCGEPHCDRRGATRLAETASEIATCDAFVSGDSGLHHVAVALGVPTVALFGQSSVEKAHHPAARVAPRVFGPCETPEDFADIDPRAVAAACFEPVTTEALR